MCSQAQPLKLSLLFISDLHLNGYCKRRIKQLNELINAHPADLILLGGDYVDTQAGLPLFDVFLAALPVQTPVVAVWGNHDHYWGMDQKLRPLWHSHGITLLEKTSLDLSIKEKRIRIDGNIQHPPDAPVDTRILLTHIPQKAKHAYDLALAGHLHGSQLVFWQNAKGLYPGRYFYTWNLLETKIGNCLHVVSRGIGDTLPIRYNCPREIILLEI